MSLMGADFETPHEFKAGDTISAEMMNELFQVIERSLKELTMANLVGSWSCTSVADGDASCNQDIFAFGQPSFTGWSKGSDNLYWYINSLITFSDDGDGTFSYTTSKPNSIRCNDAAAGISRPVNTTQGIIILQGNFSPLNLKYSIRQISPTKFVISRPSASSVNAISITCNKLNLAPKPPLSLTYELPSDNTSSSITLTWTDTQTEAVTGYKVNRKTVVTDNFMTVSTITDNTTRTYADTNVSDNGSYWYRVLAYNSNGEGVPSKVVKAEFPDDEAPSGSLKIDNGSAYTTSSSVGLNLSATDNKGVVGYLATESNAPPSKSSSGWTSITSAKTYSADNVSFTLSSGYGTKLVYVWYKDGKGNQSGYGASIKYKDATLDEQAPTGSLTIDNGTASTTSTSVTLNMTAKDNVGVVAYMSSESSVPPSPSSSDWVSITSTTSYSANASFTLSTGTGVKFVYVWFKDAEGNIAGYGASITVKSGTTKETDNSSKK